MIESLNISFKMKWLKSKSRRLLSEISVVFLFLFVSSCSKTETGGGATPTLPDPVANFAFSGATLAPAKIDFNNQSSNATSFSWDFGDGGTSTAKDPSYIFAKGGTYTVRLTASGNGKTNSITKTVNIQAPTAVRIKGVKITAMPFVDPSCSCGWDLTTGPDVYFSLLDNANNILVTGNTFTDITTNSLPLSWVLTNPYQITNFGATYKIAVYDKDNPDDDDLIGGFQFPFSTWVNAGYPTTITLQVTNSALKMELSVEWK